MSDFVNLRWGVSRREWVMAGGIALVVSLFLLLPYVLGYVMESETSMFTGLIMNPEDSQTYLAKMWQGYHGRFLYTIPFTPEPHTGAFVGVFYLALGHLTRLSGLSIMAMWHFSRVVADVFLFLVTYGFIAHFLPDRPMRLVAYLLAIFGSGLGWLLFVLQQPYWLDTFPIDFKEPGAHLFFTALTFPHVAFGTAMTAVSVYVVSVISNQYSVISDQYSVGKMILLANVSNLALGIAYPFLIYLIMVITALCWLYQVVWARRILWQLGLMLAAMFVLPAPLYVYYAYAVNAQAVFKAWDVQAATPSFPWPHYLAAYGLMVLLGGLWWWKRPSSRPTSTILWLWVLAVALLLYAPINAQRRFVQGVHLPLAILATAGFCEVVLPWLHQTRPWQALIRLPRYSTPGLNRLVTMFFLLLMSLSNLYLLADVSRIALLVQPDPLYRPADEMKATEWVEANTPETAVILGDYQTGSYVAAKAGRQVMLGHWAETMDFEGKVTAVATFYTADTPDEWRRNLLDEYQITHVWFGPREQALGGFDPQTAEYLQSLYSQDTITIYTVR